MSSNHHDEAGPSFSRLSYEYEWRNECRALSFTANPKKFLNADTFFSSSLELVVLLWVWVQLDESVKSRSTYVAGCIAYFFIEGAKTNTPATYCTGPSTRHSTLVESEPTTTALRSNSWAAAGQQLPYTDIDSFFVTGPTSQPFAGWSEVWKDGIRQRKESARPELRPTKTVIT